MQAVTAESHISFLHTSPVGVAKVWLPKKDANSGAREPTRMTPRLLIMISILLCVADRASRFI
jgi:hypothetical protein